METDLSEQRPPGESAEPRPEERQSRGEEISTTSDRPAGSAVPQVPAPDETSVQDLMKARRSLLMVSACVVGMPCGKPA
jgi:hypothetical protein